MGRFSRHGLQVVMALATFALLAACGTIPDDAGHGWYDKEITEDRHGRTVVRESPHERHQRAIDRLDRAIENRRE